MTLDPKDMFKAQPELYSAFDEEGMPTMDAAGEKVSKGVCGREGVSSVVLY